MRRMLVSRISRRVIAQHHIALTSSLDGRVTDSSSEPQVGIIFTGLNVKRSIEKCVSILSHRPLDIEGHGGESLRINEWPEVVINGHLHTHFAYIREHLEYSNFTLLSLMFFLPQFYRYIVFEVLKNVRKVFFSMPTQYLHVLGDVYYLREA